MNYAVVDNGGKQYMVEVGKNLVVDHIEGEKGKEVVFDKVLLTVTDGKVVVGAPYIKNAVVKGELVAQGRGEKIRVVKFKAKSRYRRATGFRSTLSEIKINAITA